MQQYLNDFRTGVKDGVPIALGYLSVSFTFGMMASEGISALSAVLISMTNLTSAGQVAGVLIITSGGGLLELGLSQLVINLRYALMSLSLSQRLHPSTRLRERLFMAFGVTDEIFAVSVNHNELLGPRYFYGLMLLPYIGWSLGTLLGACAGTLLPSFLTSVLGIALYGMFIAIIVPPARQNRKVLAVVLIAIVLSCAFRFLPLLSGVSQGAAIIFCAVFASLAGAVFFPVGREGT